MHRGTPYLGDRKPKACIVAPLCGFPKRGGLQSSDPPHAFKWLKMALSGKDCCELEVSFLAPLFYSLPAMRCGGIISSAAPLHALHVVIRPHGYTYAVGMLRAQSSISCLFGGLRGGETKSSAASLRALPVVIQPNEYLYA